MIESDILYQNGDFWVYQQPRGTFNVYRAGLTHSTRVAIITEGAGGLKRAKQEADKRAAAVTQDTDIRVRENPHRFSGAKPGLAGRVRPYVGIPVGTTGRELFMSATLPTEKSHGRKYSLVIGPFDTVRGAKWAVEHPQAYSHVSDAEEKARLGHVALRFPTASGRPVTGVPIVGIEAPRGRRKNPEGLRAHPRGGDYAWIIDQDHLHDGGTGAVGPRNPTPALVAMLDAGKGEKFRMYDDDGELYYSGRIVRIGSASHDEGFEPLDDFGAPNAGCTEIRYLHAGKWETL